MKTYQIHFSGRTKGAIGVCYTITDTVKAETPEQAVLKPGEKLFLDKTERRYILEID